MHTTALEEADKQMNTENNIEKTILSNMVRKLWSETQLEMEDLSNLAAVKIVMNEQGYMDITTITHSQWLSDGYAVSATSNGTENTDKD